ncbi:MAG: hypothetical protein BGO07_02140 [Alphaproteobacteria bacterium 40-19]|nr:MAG: hypothetical protein BGO07_02140 [Alphaproteobacteria bacterium 40-19]
MMNIKKIYLFLWGIGLKGGYCFAVQVSPVVPAISTPTLQPSVAPDSIDKSIENILGDFGARVSSVSSAIQDILVGQSSPPETLQGQVNELSAFYDEKLSNLLNLKQNLTVANASKDLVYQKQVDDKIAEAERKLGMSMGKIEDMKMALIKIQSTPSLKATSAAQPSGPVPQTQSAPQPNEVNSQNAQQLLKQTPTADTQPQTVPQGDSSAAASDSTVNLEQQQEAHKVAELTNKIQAIYYKTAQEISVFLGDFPEQLKQFFSHAKAVITKAQSTGKDVHEIDPEITHKYQMITQDYDAKNKELIKMRAIPNELTAMINQDSALADLTSFAVDLRNKIESLLLNFTNCTKEWDLIKEEMNQIVILKHPNGAPLPVDCSRLVHEKALLDSQLHHMHTTDPGYKKVQQHQQQLTQNLKHCSKAPVLTETKNHPQSHPHPNGFNPHPNGFNAHPNGFNPAIVKPHTHPAANHQHSAGYR